MQLPTSIGALVIWLVALVIVAIVAVFLFQNIAMPLVRQVT